MMNEFIYTQAPSEEPIYLLARLRRESTSNLSAETTTNIKDNKIYGKCTRSNLYRAGQKMKKDGILAPLNSDLEENDAVDGYLVWDKHVQICDGERVVGEIRQNGKNIEICLEDNSD
jgi:hypothetical protein